jgi:hypothetical protein
VNIKMAKFVSLFTSQKEAGAAVEALSAAELNEDKLHVIETLPDQTATKGAAESASQDVSPMQPPALPMFASASGSSGAVPAMIVDTADSLRNLKMEPAAETFFRRGVQDGGVLVVVEVADEHAAEMERILQANGGLFYQDS